MVNFERHFACAFHWSDLLRLGIDLRSSRRWTCLLDYLIFSSLRNKFTENQGLPVQVLISHKPWHYDLRKLKEEWKFGATSYVEGIGTSTEWSIAIDTSHFLQTFVLNRLLRAYQQNKKCRLKLRRLYCPIHMFLRNDHRPIGQRKEKVGQIKIGLFVLCVCVVFKMDAVITSDEKSFWSNSNVGRTTVRFIPVGVICLS